MPDLLLIEPDNDIRFQIEAIALASGFRVKSAIAFDQALEWLELKEFDCIVSYIGFPLTTHYKAAELLWKQNQVAPYIVMDVKNNAPRVDRGEFRLLGAEVIEGQNFQEELKSVLSLVKIEKGFTNEGFRILVVEDLDSPRDIICSYIEHLGFPNVEGVDSATEALERLEKEPFHFGCVITDINMPKVSGTELIRRVRSHSALGDIPLIVLTAHGTADCLIDCLKAGASGFLVKPPTKKDLQRELGRAVRIAAKKTRPRMATEDDAEKIREILIQKGFC